MQSHRFTSLLLIIGLFISLTACKSATEQTSVDPNGTGDITLEFDNYVGGTKLKLGNVLYKNALGEEFTVSTFNYFVSNIKLTKSNGAVVNVPNTYFLVRAVDPASQLIQLTGVPQADYTALTFTIGVDSLKSVSPATERTGALDPATYGTDNMYWSWNSGYIFLKFEGTSPAAPARADGSQLVQMHVGGYGGGFNGGKKMANNLRTVTLPIATAATVRGNVAPTIHLITDVAKMLGNGTKLSFTTMSNVHMPDVATPIADNYQGMFTVDHVHNDAK